MHALSVPNVWVCDGIDEENVGQLCLYFWVAKVFDIRKATRRSDNAGDEVCCTHVLSTSCRIVFLSSIDANHAVHGFYEGAS